MEAETESMMKDDSVNQEEEEKLSGFSESQERDIQDTYSFQSQDVAYCLLIMIRETIKRRSLLGLRVGSM